MSLLSAEAAHFVAQYGYGAVALAVGIESIGLPLPGETMLLAAAAYAGTTHQLSIGWVIGAAAAGAILGDGIGFWLGRELGYPVLLRYGRYVRLTERRIRLGQYLFLRHGGKVVFLGRFIAGLRALAAFLAGANRMRWGRFLVFNALGGIVWSTLYGGGAYKLGEQFDRVLGPAGLVLLAVLGVLGSVGFVMVRRHEQHWEDIAEQALPGPLTPARRGRPGVRG